MRVIVDYDILRRGYHLLALIDEPGKITHVYEIALRSRGTISECEPIPEHTIMPKMDAEKFMKSFAEELVRNGLIPKHETASDGELKATKLHLEDFRKLVFERGVKK